VYVAQVGLLLTNARLGFWRTLPSFLQGTKTAILGNVFDNFGIGRLQFLNWEEYRQEAQQLLGVADRTAP